MALFFVLTATQSFASNRFCYDSGPCFRKVLVANILDADYQYRDPYSSPDFPQYFDMSKYVPPTYLLSLANMNPQGNVSSHFDVEEIMNIDEGAYAIFSPGVLKIIETLRKQIKAPIIVNSGYRSPGHNSRVAGAATWSRHIYGDAVDIFSPSVSLNVLSKACLRLGAGFVQIYQAHVHCDWRDGQPDENFYVSSGPSNNSARMAEAGNEGFAIVPFNRGNSVMLSLIHPPQEDGGQVSYKWQIITPDQSLLELEGESVSVPLQKGTYSIRVDVGGFNIVEKTLQW